MTRPIITSVPKITQVVTGRCAKIYLGFDVEGVNWAVFENMLSLKQSIVTQN